MGLQKVRDFESLIQSERRSLQLGVDYKQAGVDIEQGDALVDWLKETQPKTWPHQDRLVAGIGGFSALFRADFKDMQEPCLVSCTDGVGTKVKLAAHFNDYSTVGQDLVAMCVNDMICVGAQPLFFLDYYATSKLEQKAAREFLGSVRSACIESEMALIGGETAEMPGVYAKGDFDCAGFSVGVVDRPKALGKHKVSVGDQILRVASSGFHSNGFSLIRKVLADDLDQYKEELLKPTALYAKFVLSLVNAGVELSALANITGGGLDNIPRVMPEGTMAQLHPWKVPSPFLEVKKRADISWPQILQTLNCGFGLAMLMPPGDVQAALKLSETFPFAVEVVGEVAEAKAKEGGDPSWRLDFDEMDSLNA